MKVTKGACGHIYVLIMEGVVFQSDEVAPGVIVDYTEDGRVMGVEVLDPEVLVPSDK